MIRLEHVGYRVDGKEVLKDINIDIEDGKIVVIMGLSGSGKTTLLKIMSGLLRPSSGSVYINDIDITKLKEMELNSIRRRMGVVFQYGALFDSLDVYGNVSFALARHTNLKKKEIDRIVAEKLALVGMPGTERLYPAQLSGGMQKRVGLARAIAMDPEILLYDEPTSGLDPIMTTIIDNLILDMRDKIGATSIVVSHDMKSIFKIASKIAMIYDGNIIIYGLPDEVQNSSDPRVKQFIEGDANGPIMPGLTNGV